MTDRPSILIICHSFPPFPGIGGRRWAKFAKYLQLAGHNVFAIASENLFDRQSEWMEDVKDIRVVTLPVSYPRSLITFPRTIAGRIRYKLDLMYVKAFTKGNYYDRTIFWEKQLVEKASELIEKNRIRHVFVTGAPFSLFSHAVLLKQKFPAIQLIADIRDPWTNNETAYSYNTLSKKRLDFEKNVERTVFNRYDKVLTVNQQMTSYFQSLYPSAKDKFMTVMNGFDPQELDVEADENLKIDRSRINLVFTGSYYEKAMYLFDNLLRAMEQMKAQGLGNKLHFYFFGPNVSVLHNRLANKGLEENFTFGSYNTIAKVNWLIRSADYAILFLTDDIDYSFSTKFCEYIKMRRKVLVFSKSGLTGKYVEDKKIGFHITPGNELSMLQRLIKEPSGNTFPADFDKDVFSVKRLTEDLIGLLQ